MMDYSINGDGPKSSLNEQLLVSKPQSDSDLLQSNQKNQAAEVKPEQ